jgi:hypothetical protein
MFIKDFPTTNGFILSVKADKSYPAQPYNGNTLHYITVNKRGTEYEVILTQGVFKEKINAEEDLYNKEHTCEHLSYIKLTNGEMLEFNKKLNELINK